MLTDANKKDEKKDNNKNNINLHVFVSEKNVVLNDNCNHKKEMLTNANKNRQNGQDTNKVLEKYQCIKCNFFTSHKTKWLKHLDTKKHKKLYMDDDVTITSPTINKQHINDYFCDCGRSFKHKSSLSRHKSNCKQINNSVEDRTNKNVDSILSILLNSNKEIIKNVLTELTPQLATQNITTNYNTNNNNQFNINMFLDDKCKNAVNFSDFIQSLPITPQLFDETIENGLTKSLTALLLNGLNNMNILERPIHCTDLSRKVMYVKENNTWQKDAENNIVKNGVKTLARKQRSNISVWQEANPEWSTNDNKRIVFTNLIHNALELCEESDKEQNKILKALSNRSYITKEVKSEFNALE
jgi:hypothetical protein